MAINSIHLGLNDSPPQLKALRVKHRNLPNKMKQSSLFIESETNHSWFSDVLDILNFSDETQGWPDIFGEKLQSSIKNKSIRTLSLFSGGGGLDIAFSDAGFNIVECVEIEEKFVKTLEDNAKSIDRLKNTKITCIDIREYEPDFNEIDFIIGGPPCQTFSAAGARAAGVKGLDDRRGTLFEEYVRLVKRLKPKGFLFENVYRIIGAQGGKPWQLIQEAFQAAGYKLHWRIIDAADYGVPQHRERLIIVGIKEGNFLFPYPTHGPDSRDNRPFYTAELAVKGLDTSSCKVGLSGRHGHLLNDIPPGLNYSFYTEKLGHPNPIFGWRSKFSDYLYKADPKTPVRTIKAQGGQYTGPLSWQNRPFEVNELKRLQTFPDLYRVAGSRQTAIMQLGNSVPPQAARVLALAVLDQIFNKELPFRIDYMPSNMILSFRKRKTELTKIYAKKAKDAIAIQTKKGFFKEICNLPSKGKEKQHLSLDIELKNEKTCSSTEYEFTFDMNDKTWYFSVKDSDYQSKEQYSIDITLSEFHSSTLRTKSIKLVSFSKKYNSLVALWKYLEKTIKEVAHKDDLIQLFGYYQYRQRSNFILNFHNNDLNNSKYWLIAKKITEGLAVGTPLNIIEISELLQVNQNDFLNSIRELKSIGYEIRNHNTNPQLEINSYLIPYQFPTLNERSLQRLTKL